ncbi:MAG: sigma-70 family RNA polymerase sigma factor [Acidobacteriota bacterium]|nr:MAG: sigma-70 family RNA polymerase sigma factor [Acidobacteriota bacterium]
MIEGRADQITLLLSRWSGGDKAAMDELMPVVYDELRRMARRHLSSREQGRTIQTTELIHEAYLKLAGKKEKDWQNREHFFGVAAQAMRHIMVDYARSKRSEKRGGHAQRITLAENLITSHQRSREIVDLDDALLRLAELDERKCRVVEMKFFGGLNFEEIARVLGVSVITVKRDWSFAKSWLLREMYRE